MYTVNAKDTSTAMDQIIAKLGSDAMIVSTRRVANGVEVTATSDVLDLTNRLTKPSSGDLFAVSDNKPTQRVTSSETFGAEEHSLIRGRQNIPAEGPKETLLEKIGNLLDEQGAFSSIKSAGFIDRYASTFQMPTRFSDKFAHRPLSQDEFITEFVSDIVMKEEFDHTDMRDVFIIGASGVGKSTFAAKLCGTMLQKHPKTKLRLIEENLNGYASTTLLSITAQLKRQQYCERAEIGTGGTSLNVREMKVSQFIKMMEENKISARSEVFLTVAAGISASALSKLLGQLAKYKPKLVFTKLDEQDLTVEELIAVYNHRLKVTFLSANEKLSEGLCHTSQDILAWFLRDRISEGSS